MIYNVLTMIVKVATLPFKIIEKGGRGVCLMMMVIMWGKVMEHKHTSQSGSHIMMMRMRIR